MRKPIHPKQIMAEPKQTQQFIEELQLGLRVEIFDEKILRAEHRLANLKAARDGLPIPYPNE
jgi:hypothetical protein